MATTTLREDFLGRDLQNPATSAVDYLGRATTSTADTLGRPLRRNLRANTTAVSVGQELSFAGGQKFVVTISGTTAASEPAAPAVGAVVSDGTAQLRRQK